MAAREDDLRRRIAAVDMSIADLTDQIRMETNRQAKTRLRAKLSDAKSLKRRLARDLKRGQR